MSVIFLFACYGHRKFIEKHAVLTGLVPNNVGVAENCLLKIKGSDHSYLVKTSTRLILRFLPSPGSNAMVERAGMAWRTCWK